MGHRRPTGLYRVKPPLAPMPLWRAPGPPFAGSLGPSDVPQSPSEGPWAPLMGPRAPLGAPLMGLQPLLNGPRAPLDGL